MRNLHEEIVNKYLSGSCSEEELTQLKEWMEEDEENARRLFRLEEVYQLGRFDHVYADEQRLQRASRRLHKVLKQEQEKRDYTLRFFRRLRYAAAIAALLLLCGTGGYLFWQHNTERGMLVATANQGSVHQLILPDGTKVWLNNAASLKYPKHFSDKERTVFLEGEGYFEVSKNPHRPFIVQSHAMSVRVLGTTFNLKADSRLRVAEATLIEGEIEVCGNHEEGMVILAPGQRAELNKSSRRLTVKQVDAPMDAVWKDNLIPFRQANIFAIAQVLERFYDVKIILSPDIQADKTYSGVLKKKATIESVLKSLQNAIPIEYKMKGGNIFISSK